MSRDARYPPIELSCPSDLDLSDSGAVQSQRFGDIYYNRDAGAAETRHVFIDGNQLTERWQQLREQDGKPRHFCVAETGFGTGLNFLVASELWLNVFRESAQPATLYYYAVEKYPLSRAALAAAIANYNPLPELAAELLAQYPDPLGGQYLLTLSAGSAVIELLLLFDDAADGLAKLERHPADTAADRRPGGHIDAWFLDGFAPAKNSSMWNDKVFAEIAAHSHSGSTLATFSVAATVRHGLSAQGFTLIKRPGFGHKREMLSAIFTSNSTQASDKKTVQQNTPTSPKAQLTQRASAPHETPLYTYCRPAGIRQHTHNRVAVIGAGIAGCCLAARLAAAGVEVDLFDSAAEAGDGASGNDVAVLHPMEFRERSAQADIHEAAQHYAWHFFQRLLGSARQDGAQGIEAREAEDLAPRKRSLSPGLWQLHSGVEQSLLNSHQQREPNTLEAIDFLSAGNPQRATPACGLFRQQAGWLKPEDCFRALLNSPRIHTHWHSSITELRPGDHEQGPALQLDSELSPVELSTDKRWRHYAAIALCTGSATGQFKASHWLPLKLIRGQTTTLTFTSSDSAVCQALQRLAAQTLCGNGYLVTEALDTGASENAVAEQHFALHYGASFEPNIDTRSIQTHNTLANLDALLDLTALEPALYRQLLTLLPALRALAATPATGPAQSLALAMQTGRSDTFAGSALQGLVLHNRVALRCNSTDYLPVVGPLIEPLAFAECFADLRQNARASIRQPAPLQDGLYVLAGLGSHGFTTAPLLAAQLSTDILGEPAIIGENLRQQLSPQRFLLRNIIRGRKLL